MTDLVIGVAAGLAAAFFSAISYLVSRQHGLAQRALGRSGVAVRLLAVAHLLMAAVCGPLIWWGWPSPAPAWGSFVLPACGSAGCYLVGQAGLFAALKRAEASRIAPLLGLKIVMLAGIVTAVMHHELDRRQWLAVGLSVVAAGLLQAGKGRVPAAAFGLVLAACLCFAISDIWIVSLIDGLQAGVAATGGSLGRLHAGGLAMAVTYALCGLLFLPVVAALWPHARADWMGSAAYAAAWLAAMAGLYCCFGLVGVVFGNILQSTRGLMAVALGAALARHGWHELEQRVDRATLVRRLAAALLMTAAIGIYVVDLW